MDRSKEMTDLVDDDQAWEQFFQSNADRFRAMAERALDEHRRGETRPIEELWPTTCPL